MTIIDLTTRRTRTSDLADDVLYFKPHGDLAIANGIAHLLVKHGRYDKQFVAAHCNFRKLGPKPDDATAPDMLGVAMTFEEFAAAVEPYTPEKVEELSGVPAAKIRMLAEKRLSMMAAGPKRTKYFTVFSMQFCDPRVIRQ